MGSRPLLQRSGLADLLTSSHVTSGAPRRQTAFQALWSKRTKERELLGGLANAFR